MILDSAYVHLLQRAEMQLIFIFLRAQPNVSSAYSLQAVSMPEALA